MPSKLPARTLVSIAALTLGACAPAPPPPPDMAAEMSAITKLRNDYQAAENSGDTAKLMTLYANDAIVMQEHKPAITGHDAILADQQATLSMFTPNVTLTSQETKIMGDMAYDRGDFTFVLTPKAAGEAPMTEHGKYLVLLQKGADGSWKLTREIGNTSDPMPMPMPAVDMKVGKVK